MKKLLVVVLFIALVGGGYTFFLSSQKESTTENSQEKSQADSSAVSQKDTQSTKNTDTEPQLENTAISKVQKIVMAQKFIPQTKSEESMKVVSDEFAEIFKDKQNPRRLVEFFESKELGPMVSNDSNPYTGTMMMIRTKKSLPGTRYYHAQYMGDNADNMLLQHLSYDYRPGEGSFERAMLAAESSYELSNKRMSKNGTFVSYDVGEEGTHTLWIKEMSKEDLANDLMNAYEESDEGTVKVAIELKIHEEGEGDEDGEGEHSHSHHE